MANNVNNNVVQQASVVVIGDHANVFASGNNLVLCLFCIQGNDIVILIVLYY